VICTHNLAEADDLADQIAIIRQGKIIASGTPEALKGQFLGPTEYEVRFAVPLNGHEINLPASARLGAVGQDWFRFQTISPEEANPMILKSLLEQGLPVLSLYEIPRSVEQVYINAISAKVD
jgi:ABC-2 type transport system ATP-binding protein